jgi:hypothetical protein
MKNIRFLWLTLLVGCLQPMPPAPVTMTGAGAACVDHCQARYESCVNNTASLWAGARDLGAFQGALGISGANLLNDCRDNLRACYRTCS